MPDIKPIVVAIWCGVGKPNNLNEYLHRFVMEMNSITRTGVMIKEYRIDITRIVFCADSPARSYLKGTIKLIFSFTNIIANSYFNKKIQGTVYFNHKHGCQKCTVVGTYFREEGRTSYPQFNLPLRTDESFRNRNDPLHHKEKSLLENLESFDGQPFLDMIKDFPVSDDLHLMHEGVTKRVLRIWIDGSSIYKDKWSASSKTIIDQSIYHCNKNLPSDINRQVRALKYMKYFKATEFRTILLYTGMFIFKQILRTEIYDHFLHFCLAVRLCSCRTYVRKKNMMNLARALFSKYCNNFVLLYGSDSIVSNIHNISHIVDDVESVGALSDMSTYPFEIFLREIKLRTRPSRSPLEQVTRRLVELTENMNSKPINLDLIRLERRTWCAAMKYENKELGAGFYKFIQVTPNVFLSTRKLGDSWFITYKKEIVQMKYATQIGGSFFICGNELNEKSDFFLKPYLSSSTDIYLCSENRGHDKRYALKEIKAKMICIPSENQYVMIPLLHSIDECNEYNVQQ